MCCSCFCHLVCKCLIYYVKIRIVLKNGEKKHIMTINVIHEAQRRCFISKQQMNIQSITSEIM